MNDIDDLQTLATQDKPGDMVLPTATDVVVEDEAENDVGKLEVPQQEAYTMMSAAPMPQVVDYDERAFQTMPGRRAPQRVRTDEDLETLGNLACADEDEACRKMVENGGRYAMALDERSLKNPETREAWLGADVARLYGWDAMDMLDRAQELFGIDDDALMAERAAVKTRQDAERYVWHKFERDARGRHAKNRQRMEKLKQVEANMQRLISGGTLSSEELNQTEAVMVNELDPQDFRDATEIGNFLKTRVRPLGNLSVQEAMRRLDGMEVEMMAVVGDDERSARRAAILTQGLLDWAKDVSRSNKADMGDELMVAVGKQLNNMWRAGEAGELGYESSGYMTPTGNPDFPNIAVSDKTKEAAQGRLAQQLRYDRARGTLRTAVNEAMSIDDSEMWYNKGTRIAARMAGETAPYLVPGAGQALGAYSVMGGGTYEQYTLNLADGMEPGAAFVNALENSTINAAVEAMPWGRAISRIGGRGLSATFGKMMETAAENGRPFSLSQKMAIWANKSTARALAAETVGSIVDEAVLEPIASGFMQYGIDHTLDMFGIEHGKTNGFWDDFEDLKQFWTDPYQFAGLALFSAAMSGSYTPAIRAQVKQFAKNKNFWMAEGLTEKEAEGVTMSENPWEEGRKAVQDAWKNNPEEIRQRRLDNNAALAANGGVLVLTGTGTGNPDLDDGGMVNEAAAAVWNDYVDRGILPHVERVDDGHVRIWKAGAEEGQFALDVTLTNEQADAYLVQQLENASAEETELLRKQMADGGVYVDLRREIASHLANIAGSAATRAVEESSGKTGIEFEDVLEGMPEEIKAKIRQNHGRINYAIAQQISEHAQGLINAIVNDPNEDARMDEAAARDVTGMMGRLRSLGQWADFARDFANRAAAGGFDVNDPNVGTSVNRSRTGVRSLDGNEVMGELVIGTRGEISHFGMLEDVTESFVDRMLFERGRRLLEENQDMTPQEADAKALAELHSIVRAARDAVSKGDPSAKIEEVGEKPDKMQVVEALSTMALSRFALGDAAPRWMRSLSSALVGNLQAAAAVQQVQAAYANLLKSDPKALEQMEKIFDKLGLQVRDVMQRAQITAQDIQAWQRAHGYVANKANGPVGNGGASVTDAVAAAEKEENDIRAAEKREPVQKAQPVTGADLERDFGAVQATPNEELPTPLAGVFENGCVFNAAGGYYTGLVRKDKLKDGTPQVKKGSKGKHGVIAGRELVGKFQADAAPLTVWKRKNGELWVISGRHRYELMLRDQSCEAHLCNVYEEDDEHDERWARLQDYEQNMRDDQADELTAASYVRETGYTDEELREKGLLRNDSRSKRGCYIGREAREELWTRFQNGAIKPKEAEIICTLTKGLKDKARINDIQAQCCALLEQKKSWEYIGATVQFMASRQAQTLRQGRFDFGADFTEDMDRMASWVEKNLNKINEAIRVLKQGTRLSTAKRGEAERLGVNVVTTNDAAERLQLLNDLKARFEFIGSYPELVSEAAMWDGETEVDPVGRMMERARAERAETEAENEMSDEELLEKRERELAALNTPTLFEMHASPLLTPDGEFDVEHYDEKRLEREETVYGTLTPSVDDVMTLWRAICGKVWDNTLKVDYEKLLPVCPAPAVLRMLGLEPRMMAISANVMHNNATSDTPTKLHHDHFVTREQFEELPLHISNPIAVFIQTNKRLKERSYTKHHHPYIILTNMKERRPVGKNGDAFEEHEIIVALHLDIRVKTKDILIDKIATVFGKDKVYSGWTPVYVNKKLLSEDAVPRDQSPKQAASLSGATGKVYDENDLVKYKSENNLSFSMDDAGARGVMKDGVLDGFFEPLQDGWMDVPIESLYTLKDEPQKSVDNALRFMRLAAQGEGAKRTAVAVADNGDGTYTIVDGNATSRALAQIGAPAVRVQVVGRNTDSRLNNSALLIKEGKPGADADGEIRTHGLEGLSKEAAERRAFEQAEENLPLLEKLVQAAAKKTGGESLMRPANSENGLRTKKPSTARDKANRDYEGDISRVVDLIGGTVAMPTDGDFHDAEKAILKLLDTPEFEGCSVAKVKKLGFKSTEPCYRDIKFSIRFKNGGIGEIILVDGVINDAKFNRGGHDIYDVSRELKQYKDDYPEVQEAVTALDELSSLVYQTSPVDSAAFERAKANASSALTNLQGVLSILRLSSLVATYVKSSESLSNKVQPASVYSAAKPSVSLMQNMVNDNVAQSDSNVNDAIKDFAKRLGGSTMEMDRNLAAVHSLSADKLVDAAALGGMPMPSIAVTRLDKPYRWGLNDNIYLVGNPDLADPRKRNEVFSRDAWTGMMPTMYYKRMWDANEFRKEIEAVLKPYGLEGDSSLHDELLQDGQMYGYVPTSAAKSNNRSLRWYWALTQGGYKARPVMKPGDLEKKYPFMTDKALARKARAWAKKAVAPNGWLDESQAHVYAELMQAYFEKKHEETGYALYEKIRDKYANMPDWDAVRYARDFVESLPSFGKKVPDDSANEKKLNAFVDKHQKQYEAWAERWLAEHLGEKVFEMPKYRKDRSGNVVDVSRKTMPVTLDNLMKYFKQEKGKSNAGMFPSLGLFFAAISKQYRSMNEVKAHREDVVSSEEADRERKEFDMLFHRLVFESRDEGLDYEGFSVFELADFAEPDKPEPTAAEVEKAMGHGKKLSKKFVSNALELVRMARRMPTDYMESVPQRAVMLEEFEYAVMPESMKKNKAVMGVLRENGITPVFHDGTDAGYQAAMAGLVNSDVSFQMSKAAEGAMDILRGRENEVEGQKLIEAWQSQVDAWSGGRTVNKLADGQQMMAELRSLIAATRAVLPDKYGHMGGLRFTLQWAEVYAEMVMTGEVPPSGMIDNPIFEKVRERLLRQAENTDKNLFNDSAAEALKEFAGMKMEAMMRRVAENCRGRLERWLKDKELERMEEMIEKSYPKREPGRKSPRGKMAAEVYRRAERARELMQMGTNDVADLIDALKLQLRTLEKDHNGDADYEQRHDELEDKVFMAQVFGNLTDRSLDDVRKAANELAKFIVTGKTAWKAKLEAERAHTKWLMNRVMSNFKVPENATQEVLSKRQMRLLSKKREMIKGMKWSPMSLAQMMLALRPVLGKEFCDEMRRNLAEHHKDTMKFNNELNAWMTDKLSEITGLKTEDEINVWLNDLNQEVHTGVKRVVPQKHSVTLEIDAARRWVNMTAAEREAERKRIKDEGEAKEQLDTNVPNERHIELMRKALDNYDAEVAEVAKLDAMSEEEQDAYWAMQKEGKDREWIKRNSPGALRNRVQRRKYITAEDEHSMETTEIVATKEGLLYTLLLLEQDDYQHLAEVNGLDAQRIEQLREIVGPEAMQWGYAMRDKLKEMGADLRTFYEEYTGVPLGNNPRYFPGAFKMEAMRQNKEAVDQEAGAGGGISGGKTGCLIARRHHNKDFDWLISASATFRKAMHEQFNYISATKVTRELKNMLNNKTFSQRLEAELGSEAVAKLTSWIDLLEGATLQDGRLAGLGARLLNFITKFYALSRLAGNVYTWVKQTSGILHGYIGGYVPDKVLQADELVKRMTYHHIGFGEYNRAMAKVLMRQGSISMADVMENDYIKQRLSGKGRTIERTILMKPNEKLGYKAARKASDVNDALMDTMEKIDRRSNAFSMLVLANAIYDKAKEENEDGRVSDEAIRNMALTTAGLMIDIAAQPKLKTQKSHFGAAGAFGGAVTNMMLLFKSESLNKFGLALSQIVSGEVAAGLGGYMAFGTFNAALLWAINWLRGFWDYDDDDKSRLEWWQKIEKFGFNVVTADMSAVPVIGETFGDVETAMFGGYSYSGNSWSKFMGVSAYNAGRREVEAIEKQKSWDAHFINMMNLTREVAGMGGWLSATSNGCVTFSQLISAAASVGNLTRPVIDVYHKVKEALK